MNKINYNRVYRTTGKVLCGCAGAIIGFLVGGPLLAVPGVVIGFVGGHLLENQIANPVL